MTAPGQEPIDLIDALNTGRISRRDFVRRGALLGLSVPTIAAVLAACGDDDDDDAETADTVARPRPRGTETAGTDRGAQPAPPARPSRAARSASPPRSRPAPLDPIAMQDLGTYGVVAQCFEFLCHARRRRRHRSRPRRVVDAERRRHRVDVRPPPGRQVARRHRLHVGRRRRHVRPPRRPPTTPASRVSSAPARSTPPTRRRPSSRCSPRTATSRTSCRCTTRSRSSRPPRTRRAPRSTPRPNGTGPWKLASFDAASGAEFAAQRRLLGWRPVARDGVVELLRRRGVDGHRGCGR